MKKITGWENLDANNEVVEFDNIKAGAYICQIKSVEDVQEKEYLKIKFDIVDGEYKNYFTNASGKNLLNWSNQGTMYRSYKQSADKFFRAFITAIEKSNVHKNYKWNWDENSLVGCFFAGVFGDEEYVNKDEEIKVTTRLQDVRSVPALKEGKIKLPELKKLKEEQRKIYENKSEAVNNNNSVINDIDLPF